MEQADKTKDESAQKASRFMTTFLSQLQEEWDKEKKKINKSREDKDDPKKRLD